MSTPRTIRLPWTADERGSFRQTSLLSQGAQATKQMLGLSLQPRGATTHPWLQDVGFTEEVVFAKPESARVDILAQVVKTFAGHAARERAELVGTPEVETIPGRPGVLLINLSWRDLRTDEPFDEELEVGG